MNASLQVQQNTMEALQQRVVQIARDACPLADALFQAQVELLSPIAAAEADTAPTAAPKTTAAQRARNQFVW